MLCYIPRTLRARERANTAYDLFYYILEIALLPVSFLLFLCFFLFLLFPGKTCVTWLVLQTLFYMTLFAVEYVTTKDAPYRTS
jgi:hypothetical protein